MPVDQINYNAHVIKLDNEYEIKKELYNIKTDKRAYNFIRELLWCIEAKSRMADYKNG